MVLPRLSALALVLASCADPVQLGALTEALRPDTQDGGLTAPVFARDDDVEHFDSASFRVHFTRSGQHAVTSSSAAQTVAGEYERVLAHFRDTLGFLPPRSDADLQDENGGDGRFDVYLLNFPNSADGAFRAEGCDARTCTGYMLQENDFNDRGYPSLAVATRILASHELFHAVQNAYRALPSVVLTEATAVWASELYDPSLPDFEGFLPAYFARPERSLLQEPIGPPDAFSYAAGLFFVMISESCQPALVRALWEELAKSDDAWPLVLDRVLQRDCASTLAETFLRFARWNLQTGPRAKDSYANAARYPEIAELEITLPHEDEVLRTLPLSTHYFVTDAEGSIAAWTNASELSWLLAAERADGTLREVRSASSTGTLALQAGERAHVALVDPRSSGNTLRASICIGSPDYVRGCAQSDAGVTVEIEDASVSTQDAGVTSSDAGTMPTIADTGTVIAAPPMRNDDGCTLAHGSYELSWLLLALVRRRRG